MCLKFLVLGNHPDREHCVICISDGVWKRHGLVGGLLGSISFNDNVLLTGALFLDFLFSRGVWDQIAIWGFQPWNFCTFLSSMLFICFCCIIYF
jgi:hypothetical protein